MPLIVCRGIDIDFDDARVGVRGVAADPLGVNENFGNSERHLSPPLRDVVRVSAAHILSRDGPEQAITGANGSRFYVLRSTFGVLRSAFYVPRSAFGVRRAVRVA
jgi:hypothetical protein